MTTAGEFCNRWVVFVRVDEPLRIAAERMRAHHVGSLVVVEEHHGGRRIPVGMITDRDLVVHVLTGNGSQMDSMSMRDMLRHQVVTASESEPLIDVVKRMRAFGIRRIPVVDRTGALQGLITFDDVIGFVADELGELAALLAREQERERTLDQDVAAGRALRGRRG